MREREHIRKGQFLISTPRLGGIDDEVIVKSIESAPSFDQIAERLADIKRRLDALKRKP